MAIVRLAKENREISDPTELKEVLGNAGITHERWEPAHEVPADAPAEEILKAYESEIERLKKEGGYVTADVIDCSPETPGLDDMLNKFNKEHWHDEDEVRFVIEGKGVFHIHPENGDVLEIEVHPGDLLKVPQGTHHWFNLCETRRIRCIRLFQEMAGWTPHYTETGVDSKYLPVCLGPAFVEPMPKLKSAI